MSLCRNFDRSPRPGIRLEEGLAQRDEVEKGRVDAVAVAEELFECGTVRFEHGERFGPRDGRAAASRRFGF